MTSVLTLAKGNVSTLIAISEIGGGAFAATAWIVTVNQHYVTIPIWELALGLIVAALSVLAGALLFRGLPLGRALW